MGYVLIRISVERLVNDQLNSSLVPQHLVSPVSSSVLISSCRVIIDGASMLVLVLLAIFTSELDYTMRFVQGIACGGKPDSLGDILIY